MKSNYLQSIPELSSLFENADYVEEKNTVGPCDLRTFISKTIFYNPSWMRLLFKIRGVLVRLMGMKQEAIPSGHVNPSDISFTPGDKCQSFTVTHGKDNEFIAMFNEDKHLSAHLIMASVPQPDGNNRFYVGTIVHHKHWTGPVYFTIIKPFHHLIVWRILKVGVSE